jgi:gluconolactonase
MYLNEVRFFLRVAIPGFVIAMMLIQCKSDEDKTSNETSPVISQEKARSIVVLQPDTAKLASIIAIDADVEILGEGFTWSEGPLWIGDQQMLLFTDVPANKVFSWTESGGVKEYLHPSGYTGTDTPSKEPGANGLTLSADGQLLLCQHGDRRIARMEAPLREPKAVYSTVADTWQGKRFNSPNDLIVNSKGQIFFTDPPYGLDKQADDPAKEIDFHGVYRRDPDGMVHAIVKDLTRPNGLALSPDEQTLYVSNSDPDRALWMAYTLDASGNTIKEKVFYDATSMVPNHKGLPDGLKVNRKGILFATGPGGVWIFDPQGTALGRIETGQATANCALNTDQSILYICADDYLMRVRLKS